MKVFEKLEDYVNSENKKYYLYISKNTPNLSYTEQHLKEHSKLGGAVVYLSQPIGLGHIGNALDEVFYDVDSTTEEFIRESVKLNEGATIRKVQPSTMRIESL